MISLKSAFKHSFHDNSNMYKRQTLGMKKEKSADPVTDLRSRQRAAGLVSR